MSSVPYIGAKISLISRSEIRYEGVLAEVDPKESTIGLENVRMMGTEDRKGAHEHIPMNSQVYEFVLFRSLDIKDLQVCEAPPQASLSPPPQMAFIDPAIVMTDSRGFSYPQQQPYGYGPKIQFGSNTPMQYGGYNQYQQQQQHQNSPIQFGNARGMFQQPTYQQQTPVYQQQPQAHQQQPPSMYDQASFSSTQEQPRPKEERVLQPFITQSSGANSIQPMHPETASNLVSLTPKTDKREENRAVPPPASKPASSGGETAKVLTYSTETKKIEVVEKPVFSYASMVSQGRSDVRRKPAERTGSFKPAESHPRQAAPDFAFKSSDASIANLSNAQAQVLQNIQQRGDSFYSKTSFFDDISSDAKESKGGDDSRLKNERSWNMETFGIAAPPRAYNNHPGGSSHGRGSYRGSSSRGSYRGGRGGAHS